MHCISKMISVKKHNNYSKEQKMCATSVSKRCAPLFLILLSLLLYLSAILVGILNSVDSFQRVINTFLGNLPVTHRL